MHRYGTDSGEQSREKGKGKGKGSRHFSSVANNPNTFYGASAGSDGGDGDSVSSVSTMETVDDNPGTGRVIDKYVYQKGGRKVERLFCRIGMSFLSPDKVVRYIMKRKADASLLGIKLGALKDINSLSDLIVDSYGAAALAGVKNLIRQTR